MDQQTFYGQMVVYRDGLMTAMNHVHPPVGANAGTQVYALVDLVAQFVAQVIVEAEIVEAEAFTEDLLHVIKDGVVRRVVATRLGRARWDDPA